MYSIFTFFIFIFFTLRFQIFKWLYLGQILSYHNKPYINGNLIYSDFRWCINLDFTKFTLLTGFVVQGHIFKVLLSHMCEEMKVIWVIIDWQSHLICVYVHAVSSILHFKIEKLFYILVIFHNITGFTVFWSNRCSLGGNKRFLSKIKNNLNFPNCVPWKNVSQNGFWIIEGE